MATEVGIISLIQLQKLALQQQQYTGSRQANHKDDPWEVRAFAEDTGNAMGTTWPPRSYTCSFCRREFRSAQALGGHMNLHRRDRARLHHISSSGIAPPTVTVASSSPMMFLYPILSHASDSSASALLSMGSSSSKNLGALILGEVGMGRDGGDHSDDGGDAVGLDLELRLGW